MAFPTTGILDNFNRGNEGPPPSASWVNSSGTGLKVSGNACIYNGGSDGSSWGTQFAADQECYAALYSPTNTSLYARLQTANSIASDHYQIYFVSESTLQFYKSVSTIATQMGADVSITHIDGDVWGIECNGTTIKVYQNGIEVASRTDSGVAGAGYIGAILREGAVNMENFGGGTIVSAPTFQSAWARGSNILL